MNNKQNMSIVYKLPMRNGYITHHAVHAIAVKFAYLWIIGRDLPDI